MPTPQLSSRAQVGILLINTGSPDAPTPIAVKRYLAEFLGDQRVVELPRWKWWPILHGIILQVRPKQSAKRYQGVWTQNGSPLIYICQQMAAKLEKSLQDERVRVFSAMCYGHPSVREAMDEMRQEGIKKILVLPLFAQYSAHTTGSCLDSVFRVCLASRDIPELRTVHDYHMDPLYIQALKTHIEQYWKQFGRPFESGGKLILSFHGIPAASITKGDPYRSHCEKTAEALATSLGLSAEQWTMAFQSRFGREEWLQPYTRPYVEALAEQGIRRIDVFCPGFSADCLETLEEINDELRHAYLDHLLKDTSGEFHYIPAINDSTEAIAAYRAIVEKHLQGWLKG